jgi:hypothetical protein
MNDSRDFLSRAEQLIARIEALLPAPADPVDWCAPAYLWRRHGQRGALRAVHDVGEARLDDLLCIDEQKAQLDTNTRQFLAGAPANNVLLWGPRGTGKSSVIRALLNTYRGQGLRIIEVERDHLIDIPDIVDIVAGRPERFLLFCDDLSFEGRDQGYKALKVLLDGSVRSTPKNVLVYATSNRRHLLPEHMSDNQDTHFVGNELHHGEAVEERISLSERFGVWLAFHPFSQDEYLSIVRHWLDRLGVTSARRDGAERAALQWALLHGSRSGRSAWQFAKDWAGREALQSGANHP